jgi:hypothetical protein
MDGWTEGAEGGGLGVVVHSLAVALHWVGHCIAMVHRYSRILRFRAWRAGLESEIGFTTE